MIKLNILSFVAFTSGLLFFSCQPSGKKELTLNPLFSDHMVLQQQEDVAFWGEYTPKKKISVKAAWGSESTAKADEEGNWNLRLATPEAGGPFEVSIITKDSIVTLKDVMVGEVWLASGQSNMEMPLEGFLPNEPIDNYKEEIADADKKYVAAKAAIVDDKVEVSAASVTNPAFVRYAWRDNGVATLFNEDGLPASSFTTED